jgi:DNA-binding response OmpR family regulator
MEHILIIDNEEGVLECLRRVLSHLGYDVKVARGGKEGIELFDRDDDLDLVITEISLPGKNGNEVARYIRNSRRANIPVVAMIGLDESVVHKGLFNVSLMKPFRMQSLVEAIRSLS